MVQPFNNKFASPGAATPARAATSPGMMSPSHSQSGFGMNSGRSSPTFGMSRMGSPGRSSMSSFNETREKGLSMSQSMALSACSCSAAFKSTAPRLTPVRTYAGSDSRAVLSKDPFQGKHAYQYQSPHVYNNRIGRNGRHVHPGIDAFRYGIQVKEPLRASSPFTSGIPRLTAVRPLEPLRRATYGPELNSRAFTYLPFHQPR
jgi:hypothetical protein